MFGSPVSSHSRQIQSPARSSCSLRPAGTIVTPQAAQIGGRSSSMSEVCVVSEASRNLASTARISRISAERLWSREVTARVCAGVYPREPDEAGAFAATNLGVEGVGAAAGLSLGVCPGDRSMNVFRFEKVVFAGVGRTDPEDDPIVEGGITFPLGIRSRIDRFGKHRVSIRLGDAALVQCSGMRPERTQ